MCPCQIVHFSSRREGKAHIHTDAIDQLAYGNIFAPADDADPSVFYGAVLWCLHYSDRKSVV